MGDLIERQKALDELKHEMKYGAVIDQCGLDTAYDIIKDLPSAELEEWIAKVDKGMIFPVKVCGICHSTVDYPNKYCSGCGAKLDWSE